MLTRTDLEQIRNIVQEEVKGEVSAQLKPIKNDINTMKVDINTVKSDISTMNSDINTMKVNISTMKKDIVQIRKDQKTIVSFFDSEYLELRKRVERIEEYLKLASKN